MPTQLSHRHTVLILNGVRFTGLSDDDPPVELPQITLADTTTGQDGTMYSRGTSMQGGEVVVKLLPTSPQVKYLMRKHAEIQAGARVDWSGTYGDPSLNYSTKLEGGVLTEAPPGISPGKNAEFTFTFEQLIPEYDAAKFAAAPFAG